MLQMAPGMLAGVLDGLFVAKYYCILHPVCLRKEGPADLLENAIKF